MAAAFSSTLYMYNAILSTFGLENKLCRVVNCKSGMAGLNRREDGLSCRHGVKPPLTHSLAARNALVCGQFRIM